MSLLDDIIAAKERILSGAGDEVPYSSGRTSIPGVPDPRLEAELLRQYLVKSGELLPTPDVRLAEELARQKRVMAGETSKQIVKPATAPVTKKPAQTVKKKSVSPAKVSNKRTVQPLRTSPTMTRPYSPGLNIPQLPAVQSEIIRANLEQESNQNQRSRMAQFLDNLRMSASEGMEEYQKNPLNPRAMKSVSKTINRTAKRSPGIAEISLNDLIGKLPEGSLARQKAIESLNALRANTELTKSSSKVNEANAGAITGTESRSQGTYERRNKGWDKIGPETPLLSAIKLGSLANQDVSGLLASDPNIHPSVAAQKIQSDTAMNLGLLDDQTRRWIASQQGDLTREGFRWGLANQIGNFAGQGPTGSLINAMYRTANDLHPFSQLFNIGSMDRGWEGLVGARYQPRMNSALINQAGLNLRNAQDAYLKLVSSNAGAKEIASAKADVENAYSQYQRASEPFNQMYGIPNEDMLGMYPNRNQ